MIALLRYVSLPVATGNYASCGDPVATRCGDRDLKMPAIKLTKSSVAALGPRASAFVAFDATLPGFGVRVQPTGAKSFVMEYRPAGAGRSASKRRLGLGSVDKLTLDDARRRAKATFAIVAAGRDPMAEYRLERASSKVSDVAQDWLRRQVDARKSRRTAEEYRRVIERQICPVLGTRKLKDLRRADASRLHAKISVSSPVAANKALAVMSSLWTWAAAQGLVSLEANPTRGIERNREEGRERYLSEVEMAKLGAALRLAETEGLPWLPPKPSKHSVKAENQRTVLAPGAVAAMRLLVLTGMRLREVLHLRWSEIDFQRGIIFLATSKTGRKPVIINAPALHILSNLPKEHGTDVVLPGENGKPRADLKRPWMQVTRAAGLTGLRIHDLRHSNASIAAGAGISLHTIGGLLGHKQAQTTQRYAHLADDPLRRAAELVGSRITTAMSASQPGEVTSLRAAR